MNLTVREHHYLKIHNAALREKLTYEQIAEKYHVSQVYISKCLRWAERHGANNLEAAEDLDITIASLQKRLDWLEKQRKLKEKESVYFEKDDEGNKGRRIKCSVSTAFIAAYLRESRSIEMTIAELKGIYKNTLQVDVNLPHESSYDYSKLTDEELVTMQNLKEKILVNGSN